MPVLWYSGRALSHPLSRTHPPTNCTSLPDESNKMPSPLLFIAEMLVKVALAIASNRMPLTLPTLPVPALSPRIRFALNDAESLIWMACPIVAKLYHSLPNQSLVFCTLIPMPDTLRTMMLLALHVESKSLG